VYAIMGVCIDLHGNFEASQQYSACDVFSDDLTYVVYKYVVKMV